MKARILSLSAAALLAIVPCVPSALAQKTNRSAAQPQEPLIALSSLASQPAAAPCTTAVTQPQQRRFTPYTGKRENTQVQTLANGTHITTVTQAQIWRDAEGRIRTDSTRTTPDGSIIHTISVNDPTTHTNFFWTVGGPNDAKVVSLRSEGDSQIIVPPPAPPATARRYFPYMTQTLPPQTIAGFYAEGFRITRTTPAGYENNDRDLTSVQENWNSPDLGIVLRSSNDDPRNGKSTMEMTDVQQTIPDPALFKIPEGYTVRDITQPKPVR